MLSPYLDGDLPTPQASAVKAHLLTCFRCQETLSQLSALVSESQELASTAPSSDLWPDIQRRVLLPQSPELTRSERPAPLAEWRPRIAWALILASIVLALFFMKSHLLTHGPARVPSPNQAQLLADAKADIELARHHYENSAAALEQIVAHRSNELNLDRALLYREKLVQLEDVIEECSLALERNTYDPRVHRALFDAYDRKISTLQEMAVQASQ
jgi:hypothetical protein